jgi:hypothetical protein
MDCHVQVRDSRLLCFPRRQCYPKLMLNISSISVLSSAEMCSRSPVDTYSTNNEVFSLSNVYKGTLADAWQSLQSLSLTPRRKHFGSLSLKKKGLAFVPGLWGGRENRKREWPLVVMSKSMSQLFTSTNLLAREFYYKYLIYSTFTLQRSSRWLVGNIVQTSWVLF